MDTENMPVGRLQIAGFDVSSLLWDQEEMELAVSKLALHPQFSDYFKEAFEAIDYASSFWLEDGRYCDQAGAVVATMFRLRDEIDDHASNSDFASLPSVARRLIRLDHEIADSQLVATYAMVQSARALNALANWLFKTEAYLINVDADLMKALQNNAPKEFLKLVEKERLKDGGGEIKARENFHIFMGDSGKALLLANLYRQLEQIDITKANMNLSTFLREALGLGISAKASHRGATAGKANKRPDSAKQEAAQQLQNEISKAARILIKSSPRITGTELLKMIANQRGESRPTILKYLKAGGFYPR